MEQVIEFAGNHPLLSGGFVAVLLALIGTELAARMRKFREVSSAEAIRLMNRENAAVIDISAKNDFDRGHIVAALHVPMSQIAESNKPLIKLRDRPVIVCCKTGQNSPQAAGKLVALGFNSVYVLRGGMAQWRHDQQPVTRD